MAKWETAFFRSELAQEVKKEYRNLLAVTKSDAEAEQIILDSYLPKLSVEKREDERFWLALALCEWQLGRLSDQVKNKALYWTNFPIDGICEAEMQMLEKQLLSPMPERKRISLPSWVKHCPWEVGSLLAYRIISNDHPRVTDSPYWRKYVLLRVIKIECRPVTMLAPDRAWSQSMLVGLYNWIGDQVPDPEIVSCLEFTPISISEPLLGISSLRSATFSLISDETPSSLLQSICMPRIETCCCLDWQCVKGINRNEVFTYLGYDSSFREAISDFFKTETTNYSFCHSVPFDALIVKRFEQLSKER